MFCKDILEVLNFLACARNEITSLIDLPQSSFLNVLEKDSKQNIYSEEGNHLFARAVSFAIEKVRP